MRALQHEETVVMVTETCADCGVLFGMTEELAKRRRDDHGAFYCPNGHCLAYEGLSEADEAREEARQWKDRAKGEERRYEAEKRAHAATKGKLTRALRRAEAGVCVHCHRTFQDMARHMQSKHAEVLGAEA